MTETFHPRAPLARFALLLILIGLGVRFVQVALGEAPAAEAAPTVRGGAALPGGRVLLRVAWGARCGAAAVQLYAASEPACPARRSASLNWLQSQLTAVKLLGAGEYLEAAASPAPPACGARVLTSDGQPAGWLCADAQGLYRADAAGQDLGARWQMWAEGDWVPVR